MSTIDKASLIQIPSGYKSTKLYSIEPTNGTGDFTFARSSSGTRVNSEGLIETASVVSTTEEVTNGDFDTDSDWSKGSGWTISGGKARASGVSGSNNLTQSGILTVGKIYKITITVSEYVSGTVEVSAGASPRGEMNANGTYTFYQTATPSTSFYIISQAFNGAVDNVSVKEVIENNVPRLDYSDGSCASLLLEPQRTNLVIYSESFDNVAWTKPEVSVQADVATSPDGTTNADLIKESDANALHWIGDAITVTSGNSYTISVFAKKKERSVLQINLSTNFLPSSHANYDLDNGLVSASSGNVTTKIDDYGNDWFRCQITFTATSSATGTPLFTLQNSTTASRSASYQGDGTSGLYLWGAQAELGSYAISYIPSNSGSQTTRSADVCTNAGTSATFNSESGVLFFEGAALNDDLTTRIISLSDGTNTNRIHLFYWSQSNDIAVNYRVSGSTVVSFVASLTNITNYSKVAFKWKSGDFKMYVDGNLIDSDTNTTMLPADTIDTLSFSRGDGFENFYGKTKQLMVFNEALSDEELSDLTGQVNLSFNNLATFYGYTIL
jgi:hypothetical protein